MPQRPIASAARKASSTSAAVGAIVPSSLSGAKALHSRPGRRSRSGPSSPGHSPRSRVGLRTQCAWLMRMCEVLLPVIRVAVLQSARIEPAEGIVREEQRAAVVRARAAARCRRSSRRCCSSRPRQSHVIDAGLDRITRRGGGEHIGDQALVPAADLVIHGPAVVRAPVPVEHLACRRAYTNSIRRSSHSWSIWPAQALARRRVAIEVLPARTKAPCTGSEVSTRSPPSSLRVKWKGLPVTPFSMCGSTP